MMHTMSEHTAGSGGLGVSVLPFDGMGLFEQQRPRFLFKMPKVVPNQKAKFETEELFRRLSRESEVRSDTLVTETDQSKNAKYASKMAVERVTQRSRSPQLEQTSNSFSAMLPEIMPVILTIAILKRNVARSKFEHLRRYLRLTNGIGSFENRMDSAVPLIEAISAYSKIVKRPEPWYQMPEHFTSHLVYNGSDSKIIHPSEFCQMSSNPKYHQEFEIVQENVLQSISLETLTLVHLRSRLIMNGVCVMWRGWIDLERLDGVGCLEYDEKDQLERYNQRVRDFDEKQRAYRTGATQPPHLNHHHHHHHHHHGHHGHHVTGTGAGATGTIEPHLTHRQDPEMEVRLRAY
ncbi:Protein big brother [Melipona quadrifasciata]|uniref:Protein big brother n=1 Tax=Melipona quadrifasciata TaxID=166423 RepID=A0A0N1IU29_9HYME|nr:Protein big brother [Melipona quadrifasciata]